MGAAAIVRRLATVAILAAVAAASSAPAQGAWPYDQCASQTAEPDQKIAACNAALNLRPAGNRVLAAIFNNRGIGFARKDEFQQAIADFSRALDHDPAHVRAYLSRGIAFAKRRDSDRALADFDRAIQLEPTFAPAYGNRAAAFLDKGELDRAIADATTAIRLDPNLTRAYVMRGTAYARKGLFERAIADLDSAVRLDPRLAAAYNSRGIAYARRGNHTAAIADFDAALRLDPRNVATLANRGLSWEHKGDRVRALADFAAALAIDGAHPAASAGRDRLASTPSVRTTTDKVTALAPPQLPKAGAPNNSAPVAPAAPSPQKEPATAQPKLADAIAACAKFAEDLSTARPAASAHAKKGAFPACYKGRRHLDCVVAALLDEAAAIDRDYGEIVASNYPDLKDADAICRIEAKRIEEHFTRSKNFDARATALRNTFEQSAACIEQVRQTAGELDLSSMQNSGLLMKSILDNVSGPLDRAAARQRAVLRLVQGIRVSQKAMATIRSVRALTCP